MEGHDGMLCTPQEKGRGEVKQKATKRTAVSPHMAHIARKVAVLKPKC